MGAPHPIVADRAQDLQVHVLMPTARDNERTRAALLGASFSCAVHGDLRSLCAAIASGAGVALLTEETLLADRAGEIARAIRDQPPWSDFPLVVLAHDKAGETTLPVAYRESMNVMLVERPVRIRSLLSAVEVALRSRRRQYEIRDALAERLRQAEVLRENDERLQFALAAGRLGSWELHVESMQVESSALCNESFGLPADRRLSVDDVLAAIHPDDRSRVRVAARRAITRREDLEAEFRTVWPDGTTHWVLARGRATDAAGRGIRMAGVTLDVTDRRRDEQALREADRKKDDFLALLAHELRNPLAPIRNGLEILRRSSDESLRGRSCDVMDRQLGHMVRLIDDLLDVSRINRNKIELRIARIELADAVRTALETAGPVIEAAGHELVIDLPEDPVQLDADMTRLAQVFSNLLTNSAKYTERGGTIRLAARRDGDQVCVSVRDDGIGIPADALPRIFDMFSQVDRSLERSTGGLGIGLAVVKGLVELHGGTVTASSAGRGRGSEFTVRLPLPTSHAALPDGAPVTSPAHAGVKRRILVVDDNRDSADSLAALLRLIGNEVAIAYDGEEAVRKAETLLPDIVLMDVAMPRLNGLDATRRIRGATWGHDVRVIAVTGWGQEADRARTAAAGCDGHLVKPVGLEELSGLLADLGGPASA